MADRSSGNQQGGIGFLFYRNRVGDPVRDCALEPLGIHVVTDEAEEIPGKAAEDTRAGQFLQPFDRKITLMSRSASSCGYFS